VNKAWSLLWFVIVASIAATVIASWIQPYIGVIVALAAIVVVAVVALKIYQHAAKRRQF
jgi:hypothetical protein